MGKHFDKIIFDLYVTSTLNQMIEADSVFMKKKEEKVE